MRRRSAGSVFWGLALVAIGGLFLARNLGYPVPVWNLIARYWPLLIIGWGMLKLVDYFHMRRRGDDRQLFSGGEVALLILVIFSGTAITAAANISPDIGRWFEFTDDFDLWDITGNNYNYEEHHEAAAPANSVIDIVNLYGNVEIRPSDGDRIVLDVEKTIRAASREEADRLAPDFTFSIRNEGGTVRIASSQDLPAVDAAGGAEASQSGPQPEPPAGQEIDSNQSRTVERTQNRSGGNRLRFKSDLVLRAPRNATVRVNNRGGAVRLDDIAGDQTVTNKYGAVSVRGAGGRVQVSNAYGSVDIENIDGAVTVESSFNKVNIGGVRGTIDARNRFGEVELSFDQPPAADITVRSEFSGVHLELPSNSAFTISGQTRFGDIDSDFQEIQPSRTRGDRSISGTVGQGGPQIRIETRNGDIRLERR